MMGMKKLGESEHRKDKRGSKFQTYLTMWEIEVLAR